MRLSDPFGTLLEKIISRLSLLGALEDGRW